MCVERQLLFYLYRSIEDLIKDYISFVFTHDLRRFRNDIVCEFGHV